LRVLERCTPDDQPLLELRERMAVVFPAQLAVPPDPEGREVVFHVGLLLGEPAVEEHLAADMADCTGCTTPHSRTAQLPKRVFTQCVERGCTVEGLVGSMVQVDPALNVWIADLGQWDSYHGLEVGQHAAEQVLGLLVRPTRDDGMSKEIQGLNSFAIRSSPCGLRSSALSLHQLTPGSPLNHVRCRRA